MGFKVIVGKNCCDKNGYLAGEDEVRAENLISMFSNKDVDGIICLRGRVWNSSYIGFIRL